MDSTVYILKESILYEEDCNTNQVSLRTKQEQ